MSDEFTGEIRAFGSTYAPRLWSTCTGGLLQIQQFPALFAVISIAFGGDGRVTFALPDLMGTAPMGTGSGPGLTPRYIGQGAGSSSINLSYQHLPEHSHTISAQLVNGTSGSPQEGDYLAVDHRLGDNRIFYINNQDTPSEEMHDDTLSVTGQSQGHYNMQPFLALQFCMCLDGIFPTRN